MRYINGRFLTRTVTGVERFAGELLRVLNDRVPDPENYVVLAPSGTARPDWLDRLSFRTVGLGKGHLWEQTALFRESRSGIVVNLCNSGPLLHRRSLVVVHDAWVYRHPDHFSRPYRMFHQRLGRLLSRRSRLATVSRFSQGELADVLGVPPASIAVIPNAADHLARVKPNDSVLERLGCVAAPYLLLVGSFAPNKNMPRAIRAFASVARPEEKLVVVGAPVGSFANDNLSRLPANVLIAGRIADAELVALYRHATALIFPSLYEGFGIPPLEAMHFGVPVLASGIAVVREVCGDAAAYFDATDERAIAMAIRETLDDPSALATLSARARDRSACFNWSASLAALLAVIEQIE